MTFPDYTLWGLPGKLKPWAQLRLDLLHRAQTPWAGKQVCRSLHSNPANRTREGVGCRPVDPARTPTDSPCPASPSPHPALP